MKNLSVEVHSTEDLQSQCVVTQPSQPECSEGSKTRRSFRRRRSRKRSIGGHVIPNSDDDYDMYDFHPFLERSKPYSDKSDSKWKGYGAKLERTIPSLFYERELHGRNGRRPYGRVNPWLARLQKQVQNTRDSSNRVWRPFITQSFKFHQLGTSIGDAVLGLDSTGSYLVALGEARTRKVEAQNEVEHEFYHQDCKQSLVLRCYALPKKEGRYRTKAVQLLSIPLLESCSAYSSGVGNEFEEESSSWMCAAVRVPVRVWLCTDGRLGACMYRTSVATRNPSVNVVLFPLPKAITHSEEAFTYHHLSHVHVPCQAKQDLSPSADCNLLLLSPFFPNRNAASFDALCRSWLCSDVTEGIPSYLFLVDEEDGFRLTWIIESSWHTSESYTTSVQTLWPSNCQNGCASKHDVKQPFVVRSNSLSSIVVQVSEVDAGWEVLNSDHLAEPHSEKSHRKPIEPLFTITFTGFLSAASLLKDILVRRPHLITPRFSDTKAALPIFTYHLVQVTMGRIAEMLLIFSVGPIGKGCIGVFVEVDLLTQDYREVEWLRHDSSDVPPSGCGKLAFSRRKNVCSSQSTNVSNNSMNDLLEAMYPDCVTMDNLAVRIQVPVKSMRARSAPVQIAYC